MQKDRSNDTGPRELPGSPPDPDALSDGFQPSTNMRERLRNLAQWRIDRSSIRFPEDTREFRGGHAAVSRAILVSPSAGTDSTNQSDPAEKRTLDAGCFTGETSQGLKTVAVKKMKMSDDMVRVLGLTVREAEFLVELSHEHIIKLEGFVEELSNGIIWLVFLWEENGTLRDFIASAEWEIPERISLIIDVAAGVEYLHSRRPPIRHGDLKSLNILVNSKCRAVITDFGSARRLKTEDLDKEKKPAQHKPPEALLLEATFCASTNTITLTGNHYTLRWAAPELLYEGEQILCSDIWALGWVAYEVMTGFIPFQGVKDMVVITRVIQGDLPSITGDARMSLIQALCSLMLECWSIDPSKRPTAKECMKSIAWMPMMIPNRSRNSDPAASTTPSPRLLQELGRVHWGQGDYLKALAFYTKAVSGYTDNGDRKGKAGALVQLGQLHRFRSEYSQAITSCLEALEISTDIDYKVGKADALGGLAGVHRLRNEYSQAITFYSEALQIRTDIGDRKGRADALWGLAEVHRVRSEYSQAIAFYLEALEIRTDMGNRRGRADVLGGLADVHRLRHEYNQAISFFSEELQIRTEIGDKRGRADALNGLATVHRTRQEYSQAISFYSEDLQIRIDIGDRLGKAQALRGLAELHQYQKEFNQAITLFLEALQISTDIGARYGRACALLGLASVHRDQDDQSGAIRFYTEAAEAWSEIGNTHNANYASNQVAELRRLSNREEAT